MFTCKSAKFVSAKVGKFDFKLCTPVARVLSLNVNKNRDSWAVFSFASWALIGAILGLKYSDGKLFLSKKNNLD